MRSSLLLCCAIAMVVAANYPLGESNPLFLSETYHKGSVQLDDDGSLFYWLFDSRHEPSTDPLIIWLQGGPGCASTPDAFFTNGPFNLDAETGTVSRNPYSWNNRANLLFVDQPRGTGFATGTPVGDMTQVAEDFHNFLGKLLERLPQFKGRGFYLTGQSYAGRYVPVIAKYIHERGDLDLNLLGIAVGNGWFSLVHQKLSYADYTYQNGFLTEDEYKAYKKDLEHCVELLEAGNIEDADAVCWGPHDVYITPNIPNVYDIRKDAEIDESHIMAFLNRADVQEALGVEGRVFEKCSQDVWRALYWDEYVSSVDDVSYLLKEGLKVLHYFGVKDWLCNWMGGENYSTHLKWRGHCKFKYTDYVQWKDYGEYRQVANFVFLKVFEAGHMVPTDQPKVAYKMIDRWMNGW